MSHNDLIKSISEMSVIDMFKLVKELEKKFEINSNDLLKNNNINDNHQESTQKKEEKTEFNLILKEIGKNKIAVIRIVRNILSLGLKEAKDLVESAPILLKEKINKVEADSIKNQLQEVGAIIDIN